MSTEQRIPVNIEDEMRRSYLDYAMSVIIGRALPDVRDGLKPAHRRVLYAMRQMGLASNRAYRKCAKVVGEVIGNYHPHGDVPAYDTLVRLAQDFNMRYTLVDGQGNFGSVDGDSPAAYRYTEARLEALAESTMTDLDKDTVDYVPNFDETTTEPTVLPAPYPNLLVNGSTGIAVGMATNVPPHNLGEVCDGVIWLIEQSMMRGAASGTPGAPLTKEQKLRGLIERIPGPDFPTGGLIVGRSGIHEAYLTGRGAIQLRAKAEIETLKKGDRQQIIITEIPYQVNKAKLQERIADLVRDKVIEGISDIRDESDRDGMRVVIELKRGEVGEVVLNNLYKHTQLQQTFGIITLAIVGGRPRILTLLEVVEEFIQFRREVVRRRIEFELRKAEARAHILEGLRIALDQLDAVISLIRSAKNPPEAKVGLMTQFGLSDIQSQAILDMQLQRLTGLERQKILDELAELVKAIAGLREILGSETRVLEIVVKELRDTQARFADARRTVILEESGDLSIEDLIADEDVAITVTDTGYIKRTPISTYRNQRRGGKGRIGMRTRDEDVVNHLFVASTHSYVMVFSDRGRAYWLKVHEIPDVGPDGRGKAIANLVQMAGGEKIAAMLPVREFDSRAFRRDGHAQGDHEEDGACRLQQPPRRRHHRDGHRRGRRGHRGPLVGRRERGVHRNAAGDGHPLPRDRRAQHGPHGLRRPRHSVARGRRGRGARSGEAGWHPAYRHPEGLREAHGARRVPRAEPRRCRREEPGGHRQERPRRGNCSGNENEELLVITQQGKILRTPATQIRTIGRATQGVRVMDLEDEDIVVSVALVEPDEELIASPPNPSDDPAGRPDPSTGSGSP